MVCKYANNGCNIYDAGLNAKTCELLNGGPFMIYFKDGKSEIYAYCGKFRALKAKEEVVLVGA